VKEGRNYKERKARRSFIRVTAALTSDIEEALKTKKHPTLEELKEKLPAEL